MTWRRHDAYVSRVSAEAESKEAASLRALTDLIVRICEALALWNILCEHQFHVIVTSLSVDQQNMLRNMAFKHLAIAGKDVSLTSQ